jgi:glycosyltransferase involved in cell wall biosynthesis
MPPRVSIGLPVHDGERYLREAIESILVQSFGDFELLICDNASADRTGEISAEYAASDSRVKYYRNHHNLGASRNFNLSFERSCGEYFKWAAHDDVIAPDYLARCIEVLDRDPSVVVCHTQVRIIDENGLPQMDVVYAPGHAASTDPARRFADLLKEDRRSFEVFGVFRAATLRSTRLLDSYIASDRVLRAHLGLLGRYCVVPEPLFYNRDHPLRSIRALPAHHLRAKWFDPEAAERVFPHWRILAEYARVIASSPLSGGEQMRCYLGLLRWIAMDLNWARLGADLVIGVAPGSWRLLSRIAQSSERAG